MDKRKKNKINKAVVIGASAGGINMLSKIIPSINPDNKAPVFIVQHISPASNSFFIKHLDEISSVSVREAIHNVPIYPGVVYIAPPDYHLLIEEDFTLSLSKDKKVNFSRPSIDVLFETAADAFCSLLVGVILTGANGDGSQGLKRIKDCGGYTIVQDPKTAESKEMPESAILSTNVDAIMTVEELLSYFKKL